tara:strand:+ start:310 stop:843 length:534 start_codon:yes stop_codon:yes gene_type:complete
MKTYRLITLNPLKLVTKSVSGKPAVMQVKDGYPAPTPPWWPENFDAKYAYIEELAYPEDTPAEGFIWTRELTTEAYGWKQVEAPPAPNPEWYVQPAWRIRAIAKVTPYGGGMLMDGINTIVESLSSDPVQKAVAEEVFYGGNTLERDSALLVGMAAGLGLDDVELDNIFQQAASIEV